MLKRILNYITDLLSVTPNLYNLPWEHMVTAGKSTCETGMAVVVTVVKTGFSCQSGFIENNQALIN
jgi:hypothetical protein